MTEALLYYNKLIDRKGTVEAGTTQSDFDPLEKARQVSINATLVPLEMDECKVNVLDCPGFRDFVGEIKNAIRVSELCVLVVDAENGVEVGTEFAWSFAREYEIPVAIVINRMDKERANYEAARQSVEDAFKIHTVPVTLPIGEGADFKGVIDLLSNKAIYAGGKEEDIPAELADTAKAARASLIEAAAEGDDTLTEKFLEQGDLSEEEIRKGLREDLEEVRFVPVLCTSAEKDIGLFALMEFFMEVAPSPEERVGFRAYSDPSDKESEITMAPLKVDEPFSCFVFKTVNDDFAGRLSFVKVVSGEVTGDCPIVDTSNETEMKAGHVFALRGKTQVPVEKLSTGDIGVFAKLQNVHTGDTLMAAKAPKKCYEPTHLPARTVHMAIHAANRSDEDKIAMSIHRLLDADPTLHLERDSMLHQTVLGGMGDSHLEVAVERLKASSKVDVVMEPPKIQYRETILKAAEGQGRYKKQSGGRGQFGDCWIRLEPLQRGEGFHFEWAIVGGVIPGGYKTGVEKGIRESMNRGILAGYPVVDIKATCYDGSHHAVDSSDMAFQVAASLGFKQVAPKANPVILEPIAKVTISVPETYMGDVMGYVSSHRGRISGNDQNGRTITITAEVPEGEMGHFSRDLRSMTQGRAIFEAHFAHYEPCPPQVQEKVMQESRIAHDDEHA